MRLINEAAIETELPIIDAHHHLWDRPGDRYMPTDLTDDIAGQRVTKTVFVECWSAHREQGPLPLRPLGETEFVLESTRSTVSTTEIAAGIVAFVDLKLGFEAVPVIEGHLQIAGKRLKGIRYTTAWDPSPFITPYMNSPQGLILEEQFTKGIAQVQKYGLVFDTAILYHQIPEIKTLAQSFPDLIIILDHIGGPILIGPYAGKETEVITDWRRHIKDISQCPNVVVKLGGLGLRHCGFGWHERDTSPGSDELAAAMRPFYFWCIEHFGTDRCMFESNFPEDKVSYAYSTVWNAFKKMTAGFSVTERTNLFSETAARIYKL